MLKTSIGALLLSVGAIVVFASQAGQDFSREVVYRGTKLEGEVYLCTSDRATSSGFRRDAGSGTVTEIAEVSRQRKTTTWRVTLKGSQAEVVVFTGATQTLEAAEQFTVSRGAAGLLLTRHDGLSTQTITIDPSNSSFVYSGQDVNLLMNKTNIFVGSCRPYL